MLRVFAFERIAVAVAAIHFLDPDPEPGQEGAEHGARLEVRIVAELTPAESVYASRPICLGAPLWRVDLLETVDGKPGSLNRAHHHPAMTGWEPGPRFFEEGLVRDPFGWLSARLGDLPGLLVQAGLDRDGPPVADAYELAAARPEIIDVLSQALVVARSGEVADRTGSTPARIRGWL